MLYAVYIPISSLYPSLLSGRGVNIIFIKFLGSCYALRESLLYFR